MLGILRELDIDKAYDHGKWVFLDSSCQVVYYL